MTLHLSDADVRSAFDWSEAVDALRAAYAVDADHASFPPRSMARGDGRWLRVLTGVAADTGLMGAKLIAANPRAGRVSYLIPLFDAEKADLVAVLDGHSITGFRTAATSALAADLLAVPGPLRVAVIGSGFEARNHLRALAAVRELASVTVFSPTPASRTRFADELADVHAGIVPADSAEDAVRDADLVICAARSRDESPTLQGRWLTPGSTVVSIGSTLPEQREVDVDVIRTAQLVVADVVEEVLEDTGDLLAAVAEGVDAAPRTVSLSDLVSGRAGRSSADQVLLYKSVGSAVQDLAVAALCARRARELGIGTDQPATVVPVQK